MPRPTKLRPVMTFALVFTAVAVFSAGQQAQAGAPGFSTAVRQVEIHYQVHHRYGFLMDFAGFAVSVWRPCGVRHVKIALFEDPRVVDESNRREFFKVVRAALGADWQPFIRDYSPPDGERTWIFAKASPSPRSRRLLLLIATRDQEDAVLIQASVDVRHWQDDVNRVPSNAGRRVLSSRLNFQ